MILEEAQIIEVINADEPDFIKKAKKKQERLDMHVNGNNVIEYLKQVEGHENEAQLELRKRFVMSNKHLFTNLLRPVDKVFSAKGGNRSYQLSGTEETENKFKARIQDVRFGKSVRGFIKHVQKNKYYTDPAGLVFFEWDEENTYPTIKSIKKIRNYETNGRSVEWILFEGEQRTGVDGQTLPGYFFRFVDDEKDVTYHKEGDRVVQVQDEYFVNPWSKVPAIVNSNIPSDDLLYSVSPLDSIVELADKYLRTNSIKNIYEFLHGFPLFWMYHQKCKSCKGTGEIDGETCKSCNGTGASMKRDVSDMLLLRTPKDKDAPVITPDVAGYVMPDLEVPKEQREELNWLYVSMSLTFWGAEFEKGDNETATGRFLDVEPVNDRLADFSESFEDMEKRMTDIIGKFYFSDIYKGCAISYGRRFILEKPDEIWNKYTKARSTGAPQSTLDLLLKQFYQSEFQSDPETLAIMLKAMRVEPFVHRGIEQVRPLVDAQTFKEKLYFSEYWQDLDDMVKLTQDVKKLRKGLTKFVEGKEDAEPQPEPPQQ